MNDGIYDAYKMQRQYQEWDAPRCIICMQKFEEKDLEQHMMKEHTIRDLVNWATRWSIDLWNADKKEDSKK